MRWLVCDFGDVISLGPTEDDLAELARLARRDTTELASLFWSRRADYDRGDLDAAGFWSGVVVDELTDDRLARCIAADVASWTRLDPRSTAAIEACAERGFHLALLSNAPIEIARVLDDTAWFAQFEHRLFSCDLRLTKPDPAIFAALLTRLDATPDTVTFVDDRADNVAAACSAGISGVQFTSPAVFEGL